MDGSHHLSPDDRRVQGVRPESADPPPDCASYLADHRRAALQWSLEGDCSALEASANQSPAVSRP
ncbi:MAG: hypothetical protein ACRETH_08950, partial [Steroidobacteraceae bacterium]